MPTLNWIGKEAVVNYHQQVAFRMLKDVPELACGQPGSGNLIIQGDNLIALKAILPYYAGQVKCIYIDPPYNTGNDNADGKGWVYNDNVNSPIMREWLAKAVGKEEEDFSRHDKWRSGMMYPRLSLLRRLLRDDGVIFISIDEIELANLLHVMDEIFGRHSRLAVFTWVRKKKGSNLSKEFRKITEFVVAYKRTNAKIELHGSPAYAEKLVPLLNRPNPVSRLLFPAGKIFVGRGVKDGAIQAGVKGDSKGELAVTLENDIKVEGGAIVTEFALQGRFRWAQPTVEDEIAEWQPFFCQCKDFRINVARFNQSEKFKAPASLLTPDDGIGTNEDASEELRSIFPEKHKLPFDFPKPSSLVEFLVRSVTNSDKDALILDSFAGSGTTGHAVLRLNQQDEGNRRFILVELESDIARGTTVRSEIRRVCESHTKSNGEQTDGLEDGFRYCEIGDSLFDEHGQIKLSVNFADLARHVYFTETGEPLPRERVPDTPKIGEWSRRSDLPFVQRDSGR